MENIIMSMSNVICVLPITYTIMYKDYITCTTITFVALASIISHLVENHKHGMPGIGFSKNTSYILNKIDTMACFITPIRMLFLYYVKCGFRIELLVNNIGVLIGVIISFIIMFASNCDKHNPRLRNRYMFLHCIWHICIYYFIFKYLEIIYSLN